MPHDQAKNFGGLVIAVEAMVFPEYLWQVFAGQNRFWTLGIPTFLKHQRHLLTHCFGQCT
ncbi:hypothetical protein XAC217_1240001 [Xanthomonas citri pv. citri]|nr:hypothetical protein XACLC80_1420001 [Xanthomonas citri pv. citri]CEF43567.1 hypothetical protein XAC217_1240001 [Xanthomonas citri pv. citri]